MAVRVARHVGALHELVPKVVIPVVGKVEVAELVRGEDTLVEKVVDGQHTARTEVHAVGAVLGAQESGDQSGVPVVGNKDAFVAVGDAAQRDLQRRLQCCVCEQGEAELIVAEFAVRVAVRSAHTHEASWVVHKHKVHAVFEAVEVPDVMHSAKEADLSADPRIHRVFVGPVSWDDDHHAVTTLGEGSGQGSHDIAEAASFAPRRHLRRHEHQAVSHTTITVVDDNIHVIGEAVGVLLDGLSLLGRHLILSSASLIDSKLDHFLCSYMHAFGS
mmetsp:Transcript_3654/g.6663  ORF Transcript_3654/g.6663 Transcript_3654/m.6663 type:complete len:273 (-) Transcript_3654:371-1189(-)